ncbi:unnamed protein product [Rotaria sp. Silwood1]|nr:unnamed protein product [Rotaria sp. Silwood1]CAF1429354.1 unnamed protein product [Rotaria sp. Silwood1]CAF1430500.1 unnamed protein product [Rotaria sp. Silwood1]CAF3522096.1 unnamed protein product [Rotaria sp. Silwood1]CAF3602828.1 unnamed protein product [Rotaria sp. Silwood1]
MARFDAAKAIFSQVDANNDGTIDPQEFRSWAANGSVAGALGSGAYESSSYQSAALGGFDPSASLAFSSGVGLAELGGSGAYEAGYSSESGFESAGGFAAGGLVAGGLAAGGGSFAIDGADSAYAAAASGELVQGGGVALESSSLEQTTQYASAGGLYNDPNPQIIRRPAATGPIIYKQNVLVRFLQPPPVPPPGPLIIKEIRPPQPPPPPPLVVRQRAPPLPPPPPLVLRERPPVPPPVIATQTVIRRLAALPLPPRSVVIERLPPLPPKPRDIIIERWIPYGPQAKRRVIVQRAPAAREYPRPRNVIIVYDAVQARVVRQFQRLGVVQESPHAYVARYGGSLLDATTLLQHARAAGVVEDITPPLLAVASAHFGASTYGIDAGLDYSGASLSQSASFSQDASAAEGELTGLEGLEVIGGAEAGTYGLKVASDAVSGGYGSQYYASSGFAGEGGYAGGGGIDVAAAAFGTADTNRDGTLDQAEFHRFLQGGL